MNENNEKEQACTCDEYHEAHTCPFSVEINENYEECTCCPYCENECGLNI
jgi:hypothetical protein